MCAAAPQSRTLHQPMFLMTLDPWLTLTSRTGTSGATTRSPPKLKIGAKSTGPDTSTTTPSLTTCLKQISLALLAGAAYTLPMPSASSTGSARASDANNSATTSPKPMTRARVRGSQLKTAGTIPPASAK